MSKCDAKCDAISADRIELLAHAVVLVAGMRIPEAAREAVLARVTAELANTSEQRPPNSEMAGEHRALTWGLTRPGATLGRHHSCRPLAVSTPQAAEMLISPGGHIAATGRSG